MQTRVALTAILATAISIFVGPAFADDWVAVKLRGTVLQLVESGWRPLSRGDVVSDDRVIRTLGGKVQFRRGEETIDLGPQTQIQISDRTGKRFTTVHQHFGTVTIEAEVQNVQHFAVETPYLAAVVKGTKFVVTSDDTAAWVKVTRGHVAVEDEDTHQTALLSVGQSASTSNGGAPLEVSGSGKLPTVFGPDGAKLPKPDGQDHAQPTPKQLKRLMAAEEADAAAAARAAALAAGLTPKDADKAAREAVKEVREAAREAAKDAKREPGGEGPAGHKPKGSEGDSGGKDPGRPSPGVANGPTGGPGGGPAGGPAGPAAGGPGGGGPGNGPEEKKGKP